MTSPTVAIAQRLFASMAGTDKVPLALKPTLQWLASDEATEPLTWAIAPPPKPKCDALCVEYGKGVHWPGVADPDSLNGRLPCAVVLWAKERDLYARVVAQKARDLLAETEALIDRQYRADVSL